MRIHLPRTSLLVAMSFLLAIASPTLLDAITVSADGVAANSNTSLFLPAVTYDSGGFEASMIAPADVNGDGKLDLVVVNCGGCYGPPSITHGGSVAVMLGNADGTFQPPVTYGPGGITPLFVAVADVNGDGKLDLVVANRCGNNGCLEESLVGVLLGNGDGTFQEAVTYGAGGLFPTSVAIADVNGDAKPDLLVAAQCIDSVCHGSVGVLLGNGDGTFGNATPYLTGGLNAFAVAVADVNGDTKADVVVTTNNFPCSATECHAVGAVAILLNRGDGTFQPAKSYNSGGIFLGGGVAVADVNADGKPDIVAENSQCCGTPNGVVGVLLGKGDGTFKTVMTYKSGVGGWGTSAAVADVNNDGKADLVVTDQCAGSNCLNEGIVAVLLGNGDGTFQEAVAFSTGGFLANWVAVADVNSDGRPDLLVANQCADDSSVCARTSVSVLLNNSAVDTTPPAITLSVTPRVLWPPNGRMTPVSISGTITDTGSGVNVNGAAYVILDEYGAVHPRGAIALSLKGSYSLTVWLRASRRGTDMDGRRYTVIVRARDNAGNVGSKKSTVIVPHDQGH